MSIWNIQLSITDQGDKNIVVHDQPHINLKMIMAIFIQKYTYKQKFFEKAKNINDLIYKTKYATATIMNDNLGYIDFHGENIIKNITITKRDIFLLKNIE